MPVQFARAYASELGLALYEPPFSLPAPEVNLYWHKRHDDDAAHRWLRDEIIAASAPLIV